MITVEILTTMKHRLNFRFYMVLLLGLYFTMLYVFYGNLQSEIKKDCVGVYCRKYYSEDGVKIKTSSLDVQRHVLESRSDVTELRKVMTDIEISSKKTALNKSVISSMEKVYKTCFLSPLATNRTFQSLDSNVFVYSAYLDERYNVPVVRIMTLLTSYSRKSVQVFCHFRNTDDVMFTSEAKLYEMCENHGKVFGGYILSCDVPDTIPSTDVCYVNISMKFKPGHRKSNSEQPKSVILQVTRQHSSKITNVTKSVSPTYANKTNHSEKFLLKSDWMYNYTICVPPLFGNIDILHFIEFIELNRILGFQHFIIYTYEIRKTDIQNLLDYYSKLGIISLISWKLPDIIQKNKIWYNGQLTVHNDCLYRAMSITKYLAIMDIDEFMIPHNGHRLLSASVRQIINETICGLSFHSAFFDEKFSVQTEQKIDERLITAKRNGRSAMLSKVRTKVLIRPTMVFEVGIHHVSKPALEDYQVIPVDKSIAFLHHYRNCVPNYDMKCSSSVVDDAALTYSDELSTRVNEILSNVTLT